MHAQLHFVSHLQVLTKFGHHQKVHIFKAEQLKFSISLLQVLTASADQKVVFCKFLHRVVFKYSQRFRVDAEEPTCISSTYSEHSTQLTQTHCRNQKLGHNLNFHLNI
jgi:hypothetical protein